MLIIQLSLRFGKSDDWTDRSTVDFPVPGDGLGRCMLAAGLYDFFTSKILMDTGLGRAGRERD